MGKNNEHITKSFKLTVVHTTRSYQYFKEAIFCDLNNCILDHESLFTLQHETEVGTTSRDHIKLNFERQGGSYFQIVVQKEVLDCISLYYTKFQMPRIDCFQDILYERQAGTACEKGLLFTSVNFEIHWRKPTIYMP